MGFEPMTSCLLDRRSNQLSYGAPFRSLTTFDDVWPSCWSVIFPVFWMVSYTLGTRGSLSAARFRGKLKSGRRGRPNQWESLCKNTFSLVLILIYLTGILFVLVKAVRNILQSTFAAIAQNTLRAPRGKSSSDSAKREQTKNEIY